MRPAWMRYILKNIEPDKQAVSQRSEHGEAAGSGIGRNVLCAGEKLQNGSTTVVPPLSQERNGGMLPW